MLGADDHALDRVPATGRYPWWTVAVQRFGQLSDLTVFLLGATLGAGMGFWGAFWSLTLGSVILEVVAIFAGIAGVREGLSTSVLARWTGFGRSGSALIGLVVATSLIGWFGIQNAIFAEGLHALVDGVPVWLWSIVTGLAVTALVVFGFRWMAWIAYLTVPAFLLLAGWSVIGELSDHSLGDLLGTAGFGEPMSIATGATIVAGSYIAGAVLTPDMTRFNRSTGDVVKQTVVSITLGQYVLGLVGVILAYAIRSADVVTIFAATSGTIGVIILVSATVKINDWNLYSSSLGFVNTLSTVFGVRVNRVVATIAIGVLGTALSALGILDRFADFLTVLGVTLPPIAGIMVAEYFLVRRWRPALDESREHGRLPATEPGWVPATLVIWAGAALLGWWTEQEQIGIPALNSLVVAGVVYLAAGKAGLVRGTKELAVEKGAE
ncbi:purine-cytosine permease family protein [Actinophytocola algeriensis]|uniref:Cytosine permease n=1 Tax=Actinophytocola algeriensis TaxID=1768010 RepID=A0A7W7VFV6_9PSEU|nr:cytosine permease [Actinophytocola algeriensis]MBB4908489.1 cytosine permease [Actinophytocola algeriensis]MBE1475124.1 cytosine permease [Actinophytocola algeriensis]